MKTFPNFPSMMGFGEVYCTSYSRFVVILPIFTIKLQEYNRYFHEKFRCCLFYGRGLSSCPSKDLGLQGGVSYNLGWPRSRQRWEGLRTLVDIIFFVSASPSCGS